jgi:DNA-binding response OmpR family regulator
MSGERILVVEDDVDIAQSLSYQLESEHFIVSLVGTGHEAIKKINEDDLQLILLDIRLPDASGFDICREIRADGRTIPILILSALDSESDRVLGLELGADDYIAKPYKLREVVARIRSALRRAYGELGRNSMAKSISFGNIRIDVERMRIFKAGAIVPVTFAEFHLARLLSANPDKVYSRARLIEEIYGEEKTLDERSIDVHMHYLRSKLEYDPGNPRWFITVNGFGYAFSPK